MATGTQMVLVVKKNNQNNSSMWFTFGPKIRPQFQAAVFLRIYYAYILLF